MKKSTSSWHFITILRSIVNIIILKSLNILISRKIQKTILITFIRFINLYLRYYTFFICVIWLLSIKSLYHKNIVIYMIILKQVCILYTIYLITLFSHIYLFFVLLILILRYFTISIIYHSCRMMTFYILIQWI